MITDLPTPQVPAVAINYVELMSVIETKPDFTLRPDLVGGLSVARREFRNQNILRLWRQL